jgi:hypothetical protein
MIDVLSLNNSQFHDYMQLIYPNELEVKDTTDTLKSASCFDLHLEINNGGRLKTKLYDNYDDFTFLIVNLPFISNKIPSAPAFTFHNSYVILGIVPSTVHFLNKAQLLVQQLLKQG